jgi:hypothetical protein
MTSARNPRNTLRISIVLPTSRERAWAAIADWESQGDWMLQTKVWVTSDLREGVGTTIAAFTGPFYRRYPRFSKFGLLDTMTVTSWTPPIACDVEHTGDVIKGTGRFELIEIDNSHTQFNWSETIDAPRMFFLLGAPFLWIGVRISLARFQTLLAKRE